MQIPEARIYDNGDQNGRQKEIHATIKFGLDPETDLNEMLAFCSGIAPFKVRFGKANVFVAEDYVVLKIRLQSAVLNALNGEVKKRFKYKDTFRDYRPHATIAYLKKDEKDPYWFQEYCTDQFEGKEAVITELVYSAKGKKTRIKMNERIARIASAIIREDYIASEIQADLAERLNYEAGCKQGREDRRQGITNTMSSHSHLVGFKDGYRDGQAGKYNPPTDTSSRRM